MTVQIDILQNGPPDGRGARRVPEPERLRPVAATADVPRLALVTGPPDPVAEVGESLAQNGFSPILATHPGGVNGQHWDIAPRSLSCYVQLARDDRPGGRDPLERVRRFLADGLVARFDDALAVAPLLRPDACVVLVAGNAAGENTPDDAHARRDLLMILARAISSGSIDGDVKAVVVGADHSAQEIARIARSGGEDRSWLQRRLAALSPDLNYADWKTEFLGVITSER